MIKVKICRGTVCHVMGGSDLPLLLDFLPMDIKEKVEIEGTACIGRCNSNSDVKPPFAEVNGELIAEASFPKIIEKIKSILR